MTTSDPKNCIASDFRSKSSRRGKFGSLSIRFLSAFSIPGRSMPIPSNFPPASKCLIMDEIFSTTSPGARLSGVRASEDARIFPFLTRATLVVCPPRSMPICILPPSRKTPDDYLEPSSQLRTVLGSLRKGRPRPTRSQAPSRRSRSAVSGSPIPPVHNTGTLPVTSLMAFAKGAK